MTGNNDGRAIGEGYGYVSLAIQFALGIVVFAGGGFWLDRAIGTTPVATIVGTLAGVALSTLMVYRRLVRRRPGGPGKAP